MLSLIRKTAPLIAALTVSMAWLPQATGQSQAQQKNEKPQPTPELIVQSGHLGAIGPIAFSPDGSTIATGGADRTVRLWDAKTGELKRVLGGHEDEVYTVFYSRDGQTLVSQSSITSECSTGDITVNVSRFWDTQNLNVRKTLEVGGFKDCNVAISPDLKTMVRTDDNGVEALDATTEKVKARLQSYGAAIFSLDGRTAAVTAAANGRGEVAIYDALTWKIKRKVENFPSEVVFSPDGQRLVGASGGAAVMADLRDGRELWSSDQGLGNLASPTFSGDGATIAFIGEQDVKLLDAATGKLKRAIKTQGHDIATVRISPDGRTLATGDKQGNLRLWDAQTAATKPLWTAPGNQASVRGIILSPDGKTVFIARADRMISLWDLQTGTLTHQPVRYAGEMTGINLSRDGLKLAITSGEGVVTLWDLQNDRHIRTLKPGADKFELSPDLLTMAVLKNNEAQIIDTHTGKLKFTLTGQIYEVEFAWNSHLIATADDGTMKLWDARSGTLIRTLNQYASALRFSNDGRKLAFGSGNNIEIRDVKSGQLLKSTEYSWGFGETEGQTVFSPDGMTVAIDGCFQIILLRPRQKYDLDPSNRYHGVSSYAFAPDGKTFVAASHNLIDIWSVATGKKIARPIKVDDPITNVRFLPGGQRLLVASGASVSLWDMSARKMVAKLSLISFKPDGEAVNEWIVSTPQNFHYGSDYSAQFIHWRDGDQLSPSIDNDRNPPFPVLSEYCTRFYRPAEVKAAILQIGKGLPKPAPNGKAVVALGSDHRESPAFEVKIGDCSAGYFDASVKKLEWNAESELIFDFGKLVIDWDHLCSDAAPSTSEQQPSPAEDPIVKTLLSQTSRAGIKKIPQYEVSPSGAKIVFTGIFNEDGSDNEADLWLINRNGTGLRRLTKSGSIKDPAWSPVGDKIAFISYRSVKIFDLNTGRERGVPGLKAYRKPDSDEWDHANTFLHTPSWSRDGRFIAAFEENHGTGWVSVAEIAGGQRIFESTTESNFNWNSSGELEIKGVGKLVFNQTSGNQIKAVRK